MTRLKSQQVSKDEVQSVTYGEMFYTPKELLELFNLYRQKSRDYVWEWMLKVLDNGGRNIKLNQDEFIDMGL